MASSIEKRNGLTFDEINNIFTTMKNLIVLVIQLII